MSAMSLPVTPAAKALVDEATLAEADIAACEGRLEAFLRRQLPLFYREEQRVNAGVVVRGLFSGLERKTCGPVACRGNWDDEKVTGELRRQPRPPAECRAPHIPLAQRHRPLPSRAFPLREAVTVELGARPQVQERLLRQVVRREEVEHAHDLKRLSDSGL